MLSIDEFKALSIEDAYSAYQEQYVSCHALISRCVHLQQRIDSFWNDYRQLYLCNKK